METRYSVALWRPLSEQNPEPLIKPTQLIWHTMVGYLKPTEDMFRRNGYGGTESTFGLGGKYDGSLDGTLYQWQLLDHQADAQWDGNARANSIECSDGGRADEPFTDKQIDASIRLGIWWCQQTGVAPVRAASWDSPGFGYHCLFHQWNKSNHSCPGTARIAQLEKEIWPEIAASITHPHPPPHPPPAIPAFPLPRGYYFGPKDGPVESVSGYYSHRNDLRTWQRQMKHRGWDINTDGLYGAQDSKVAAQFQKEKRLTVDGRIGPQTWEAAWRSPVT
jgi:peptidoglycan hydrolase-like protein with peptidoglycan-binding domain